METRLKKLQDHLKNLEREELHGFIETKCFEAIYELEEEREKHVAILKKADARIAELCNMVCRLSKDPKKVRVEDWSEEIRSAIQKAQTP